MNLRVSATVMILVLGACATTGATSTTSPPVGSTTTSPGVSVTADPPPTTTIISGGSGTAIDIAGFAFSPDSIAVSVGTSVTWDNKDNVPHTTTSDDGQWDSKRLASGDTFSFTFDQPGEYSFHCNIHTSMKGTITVTG